MTVYDTLDNVVFEPQTALTIGTFDGVHLGHRRILDELRRAADGINGRSLVLTFHPHPQEVLRKTGQGVPVLTPIEMKLELFQQLGVDATVVHPFTKEFAATPWQHFVDQMIEKIGLKHMVVGHDHAFGKNREGNAESLRQYGAERGFTFTQVGPFVMDGKAISSTKIRNALLQGELDQANRWLDRPYGIQGTVVRGDGRGRELGIPTANVRPETDSLLIPQNGVYCVQMRVGSDQDAPKYGGMANIGVRPTFTDGSVKTIEVNLFGFNDELYHQQVTVEFLKFVRLEQNFSSKDAFLARLEEDRRICTEYLQAFNAKQG